MYDIELLKSNQKDMEKMNDLKYASVDELSNIRLQIAENNKIFEKVDSRINDHINATKYLTGTIISIISLCIAISLAIITVVKTLEDNSLLAQIQNDDKIILSELK